MPFKTLFALFVFALIATARANCEEATRNNGGSSGTGATVIVSGVASSAPALATIAVLAIFIHQLM